MPQEEVEDARQGGVREPAEKEVHRLYRKLECKLHHRIPEGATKLEREEGGITTVWNVELSIRYIHTYFMWNTTPKTEGQEVINGSPNTHTLTHLNP